jgi:hypothetical protein
MYIASEKQATTHQGFLDKPISFGKDLAKQEVTQKDQLFKSRN